nr:upf0001 protein [Quercus suber]
MPGVQWNCLVVFRQLVLFYGRHRLRTKISANNRLREVRVIATMHLLAKEHIEDELNQDDAQHGPYVSMKWCMRFLIGGTSKAHMHSFDESCVYRRSTKYTHPRYAAKLPYAEPSSGADAYLSTPQREVVIFGVTGGNAKLGHCEPDIQFFGVRQAMANESTEDTSSMHIDAQRAAQLAENFARVVSRIEKVQSGRKPSNDILALHKAPHSQLDFGENYAQELTEKAALLPDTIRWHMIGALQTNKCKPLAEQVVNLYCVSSVDTQKKADALEKGRAALAEKQGGQLERRLKVQVQVNTSGESEKSGVEPGDAAQLCRHVREHCPHLQLAGLMTIGAIARSQTATDAGDANEDFTTLCNTRDTIVEELGMDKKELELSMGMSSDFEAAIAQGSDEVRIGTTIFGQRPARKDAKLKEDTT